MKGKQFIVWRSVPNPLKPKPDKIPFNPVKEHTISAQDPVEWMSEAEAAALVSLYGVDGGVGFVLTANDPYWCVDLDSVAQADGTWSPFALEILARFPGAMVELSRNGQGLHIWGKGTVPDGHKTRDAAVPGLEVYSQGRFIALGSQARGDAEIDHTVAVCALLAHYLPGKSAEAMPWTATPVAEWAGPLDDDELIQRMLAATAGLAMMKGSATLTDLWDKDTDALSRSYPSGTPGEEYDASTADSALCSHLAWWTGHNCERIDRLFRRSELMRDKWDRGDGDYKQRTVTGACALVAGCYRQPGADMVTPTQAGELAGVSMSATIRDGYASLDGSQQIEYFGGCAWVRDSNTIMVPDGALLTQGQFNAAYGGWDLQVDLNGKPAKSAWDAFTNSRIVSFPKVHGTCFRPDDEPGLIVVEEDQTRVNTYRPLTIASQQGDVTPFMDCIKLQFPDERDRSIILAYAAACVQHPGAKFQWAPLVQGAEGNGKTFLAECITYAVGVRYSHTPNPHDIANKFNKWMANKIFAVVEEVYTRNKFDVTEALKPMITNKRMENQGKGADQRTVENCVKFFMTTNHRDAIIKTRNDRRYCVFFTAQQTYADIVRDGMAEGDKYFPKLWRWFNTGGSAMVTWYLQHYQIPDALNPAVDSNRAPETSSTKDAIAESMGTIEQAIMECVEDGTPGFRGGYVSSFAVATLIEKMHITIAAKRRHAIMMELGYVRHPMLKDGRLTRPAGLEDHGKRITVYVVPGSLQAGISGGDEILKDYRRLQGWA